MTAPPSRPVRSERAEEIVAAARTIVEAEGAAALTMRALAAVVGLRAPSLYKHFPTKRAVEVAVIEQGLVELGHALHAALATPSAGAVAGLLGAYRQTARANPALYRLAATGPFPREDLPPGLEDWAGEPFLLATGDPWRAQALFSFAHGMVILELDDRFPPGSDVGRTWAAGAAAFAPADDQPLSSETPQTKLRTRGGSRSGRRGRIPS